MKVIFLDIDGVLNVIPRGFDEHGALFDKHFVDNLGLIIQETGAKIVITSSWRISGLDSMLKMWSDRGYPGEIIDITPDFRWKTGTGLQRGLEINEWLSKRSDIFNFVILDDDSDMESNQIAHFVQTWRNNSHPDSVDDGYGLTDICTKIAIGILNKN